MSERQRSTGREEAGTRGTLAGIGDLPDEDACLDYVRDLVFPAGTPCPKCRKLTRFHRVRGRSAYACQYCGHHVYPTAATIFRRSTTSLRTWFRAIELVGSAPGVVSARDLERELGVSRKTAARMLSRILPAVDGGPELLVTPRAVALPPATGTAAARAPHTPGTRVGRAIGHAAHPAGGDALRDELLATLGALREDLRAAELRESDAREEVYTLRAAIGNLEQLAGIGDRS